MRAKEKVSLEEDDNNSLSMFAKTESRGLLDNSEIYSQAPMDFKQTIHADQQQALELDMVKFSQLEKKTKEGTA